MYFNDYDFRGCFVAEPEKENCKTQEEILIYMLKKLRNSKATDTVGKQRILGTNPSRKAQANFEYLLHNGYIEYNYSEFDPVIQARRISPYFCGLTEKGYKYAEELYRKRLERQGYKIL